MLLPSMLENGIEAEEMSFYPLFSYVMGKEEKKKMVRGNTAATI